MKILSPVSLSTLSVFFSLSVFAQTASAPATARAGQSDMPALRVAVSRVSESRSSTLSGGAAGASQSTLSLTLSITGDGLPPNTTVRGVTVTKAVDDKDRVLQGSAGRSMSPMSSISAMARGGAPGGAPLTGNATVPGIQRNTESLKYVEGTIELFVPSESSGSLIRIANIKSHRGVIEHPTLARNGIEVRFLADQASTDAARTAMGGNFSSSVTMDGVSGYGMYYRDPSNRIAGMQVLSGTGVPLPSGRGGGGGGGGGTTGGMIVPVSLASPLTDDAQLVIYLAVPEAIKTVPFRVEDIVLP